LAKREGDTTLQIMSQSEDGSWGRLVLKIARNAQAPLFLRTLTHGSTSLEATGSIRSVAFNFVLTIHSKRTLHITTPYTHTNFL
jgi:hypothetical protein